VAIAPQSKIRLPHTARSLDHVITKNQENCHDKWNFWLNIHHKMSSWLHPDPLGLTALLGPSRYRFEVWVLAGMERVRRDGVKKDGEMEGVTDKGKGREGSCPGKGRGKRKRTDRKGKSRERMKEEKGEWTLGGAGKGMFHPTVVCISWHLCFSLSQNQKHLTD